MSRKRIFGVEKFQGLLAACTFAAVVEFLMAQLGSVVAGQLLGETALSGVSLVLSVCEVVQFLSVMVGGGTGIVYSLRMGACDKRGAAEIFTQGLWTVALYGGLTAAAMVLAREWFLGYMGASAEVAAYARAYWNWYLAVPAASMLSVLLLNACYADGDSRLCYLAYVVQVATNLAVSVVLIRSGAGTAGAAIGTLAGFLAAALTLALHFFRASNSFRLVRHFSLADTWRLSRAAFGDASSNLGDALVCFFLGKVVILHYGSAMLPVMSAVLFTFGIICVVGGVGAACQPIVSVYFGEANYKAVRVLMRRVLAVGVGEGVLIAAVFLVWPELAARAVGVTEAATLANANAAVRIVALGFVFNALADVMNNYYQYIGRDELSTGFSLWKWVAVPLVAIAVFAKAGPVAMWAWYPVAVALAVMLFFLYQQCLCGRETYFLQLPVDRDRYLYTFNLELDEREIVSVAELVDMRLELFGVDVKRRLKARLMVEEVLMAVKDRNAGKPVLAEVTLDLNEGILLTIRDDGVIFDITDSDAHVSSLRSFLVASVMESERGRMNLVTTGFNRNVFRL